MLLNSMRGGEKKGKKSRTRTESCEKEREGIMWVVRSARHAERGMGDQERENNREIQRETDRGRPSKRSLAAVHSSPTLCKQRRRSQGRTGCPLKTGRGRKEGGGGEKWEKPTPALSLSRPAERQ